MRPLTIDVTWPNPPWIKMSLAELQTPAERRIVYMNRWWAVTQDDCVLFFKGYASPQCHHFERMIQRMCPPCRVVFVKVAYVPHKCEDYI